jgi:hypothetical protein
MRAHEFIVERKKKRRPRWAAYGPGLYGGYGYYAGYSGDGSGSGGGSDGGGGESINHEASYPGNIGMMELAKFFSTANDEQKLLFKQLLEKGKKGLAWKLVQDITGVKLQGKEFEEDVEENFADGKKPGRKGLAKRSGVNTKASVSSLRKTAKNSTGEKARMAHWLANMKAGRAKKEEIEQEGFLSFLKDEPPKKKWDPSQSRVAPTKKDDDNWIKLLIDKHRRGISLTDREWHSIEQWKLKQAMKDNG